MYTQILSKNELVINAEEKREKREEVKQTKQTAKRRKKQEVQLLNYQQKCLVKNQWRQPREK